MRNVWKGMVIGALTGAAAGLALDLGEQGVEKAAALGGAVARHAPDVAGMALDLGERGAGKAAAIGGSVARHAPEVTDQLRHTVADASSAAADRARSSDLPARTKAVAEGTREKVSSVVSEGLQKASVVADQGKDKLSHSVDRVRDAS
jgi:hypothetical protein